LAHVVYKSIGSQAPSTTCNARPIVQIRVSVKKLTRADVLHNIEVSALAGAASDHAMLPDLTRAVGYVLMFDKIKVEGTPRWDHKSNCILGICREHGTGFGLELCSADDIDVLCQGVRRGEVHLASEVSSL
jgi:hypothetical protein